MKIQNFQISKIFRKFFEISKFWIFIDFFIDFFFGKKSKIFGPNIFSTNSFRIFFEAKFFDKKNRITYFDPKWSQDSENHT